MNKKVDVNAVGRKSIPYKYKESDTPDTCRPSKFSNFGCVLRHKREELGVTMKDLAAASNVHIRDIRDVERRKRDLTLYGYAKICRALNIEYGQMLSEYQNVTRRREPS